MSYTCIIKILYFLSLKVIDFEVYKNLRSINDTITDINRFVYNTGHVMLIPPLVYLLSVKFAGHLETICM